MMLPVSVGELLYLREPDYKFGTGDVTLRVTAVIDGPDSGWIELRGFEIGWNGSRGTERTIYVSMEALRLPRTRRAP